MNIILTNYFTTKPDPQRGRHAEKNNQDLMAPWINTMSALGLAGVIFADHELSVDSPGIDVMRYQPHTKWSVNDERFLCWYEYLERQIWIRQVFLTDLFDVDFFKNPFSLINKNYDLYCGCGAGLDCKIGDNSWLVERMIVAYGRIYHPDQVTLNAGVIGGTRDNILRLLEYMLFDLQRLDSDQNINMAVFNRAAHDCFFDRILVGPPVTSRFKKYEQGGDFCVRHK